MPIFQGRAAEPWAGSRPRRSAFSTRPSYPPSRQPAQRYTHSDRSFRRSHRRARIGRCRCRALFGKRLGRPPRCTVRPQMSNGGRSRTRFREIRHTLLRQRRRASRARLMLLLLGRPPRLAREPPRFQQWRWAAGLRSYSPKVAARRPLRLRRESRIVAW